ncbi:hypothetical protein [Brevundimonas sp. Root1423]|uniref:hypothetical protein n=1 Tax=Brevundimonas sp. Root1423 TaxID=1736462 RepID=UPI0006F2C111|nr:hypothetical protein [Brevundimonas sp. Root1423]KQY85063.1 hypothetical protein ASD25_08735 [Brevundimonas sp. Root1423]
MTDAHFSDPIRHPLHTLISWPAVIAGGIVAVAVGAMLNLLGVALGASAFNPYEFGGGDAEGFTAAAGMWMAFANAIALFIGGAVATRAAKYADHHKGALHGLAVWALAFLLAITIASAAGAGGAAALLGGEAADSDGRSVVTDIAPASRVIEGELVAPVVVQPSAPAVAEEVADTTAMLALWGFLTMLIGAIAAIFGGLYGGRNHRWIDKAVDGRRDDHRPDDVRREDSLTDRAPIL